MSKKIAIAIETWIIIMIKPIGIIRKKLSTDLIPTYKFICLFALTITFSQCKHCPKQIATAQSKTLIQSLQDTLGKPFPKPNGYVNDFYSLLLPEEINSLDSLVTSYEKRTSTEISVVTLDSTYVSEERFDAYTLQLANSWGVGKKEKNNGILIALCPDYRRIRINNGLGIEEKLSDWETEKIVDSCMLPLFRKKKFYEGLHNGIQLIITKLDEKQ